jgi:hypothetical protein
MDFPIRPHIGAGPLVFGMSREEVRAALGERPKAFRKGNSAVLTDDFRSHQLHVYYSIGDYVEAIEFFGEAAVSFDGRILLGRPFLPERDGFSQLDPHLELDGAGLTSSALGIGLYAPFASKEPLEPVEAVIVFERGYYEREEPGMNA